MVQGLWFLLLLLILNGYWTVDNQSALTGLAAFMYLCQQFELKEEYNEAKAEYDSA